MENKMMEVIDENLAMEEKELFVISTDTLADWALDKIREIEAEYSRFEIVAKERINQLQAKLDREKEIMQNDKSFFVAKLREYFETVDKKETKTQLSYKLPSGNLKMKKGKVDFDYDKDKLLEYAKEQGLVEFIKTSESFAWADFKKQLEIQGDKAVNKLTGEIVEIEGLALKETRADFKIEI